MKALILFLYAVALYFSVRNWYNAGNSGLPNPTILAAPTYLYSALALASDFTGDFTIPIAAGLTLTLIWNSKKVQPPAANSVSAAVSNSPNRAGG